MSRPSQNIDKLLIKAGMELIPATGISGLKIRAVTKKAGVNLGMFNYHFGTKDKFIEKLLSEMYSEFFNDIKIQALHGETSIEQLRNSLVTISKFVRDNRSVFLTFLEEILLGNTKMMEHAKKNMTAHIYLISGLVRKCQRDGYLAKMPFQNAIVFLMGSVLGPNFVFRIFQKHFANKNLFGILAGAVEKTMFSDKELERRIDMALRGLSAGGVNA